MLPGAIMGSARSTTRGEAHGSRQKAAAGAARRPRRPIEARIDILEVVERVVKRTKNEGKEHESIALEGTKEWTRSRPRAQNESVKTKVNENKDESSDETGNLPRDIAMSLGIMDSTLKVVGL